MSPDRPAAVVVLAAGEGTRMKSSIPKVLHAVGGRTLVHHAVAAAGALDPDHLVVVVGHGRDRSRPTWPRSPPRPPPSSRRSSSAPATRPRSRSTALPPLDGTVVVTYGDVPLLTAEMLRGLLDAHAVRATPSPSSPRTSTTRPATAASCAAATPRSSPSSSRRTPPTSRPRSARSTPASTRSTPRRCAPRSPGSTPTTRRASTTSPTSSRTRVADGRRVGALPVDRHLGSRGRQRPGAARGPAPRAEPPHS